MKNIKNILKMLVKLLDYIQKSIPLRKFFSKVLSHDYMLFLGLIPIGYLLFRRISLREARSLIFTAKTVTNWQLVLYGGLSLMFTLLLVYIIWAKFFKKPPAENKDQYWSTVWWTYTNRRSTFVYNIVTIKLRISNFGPLLDKILIYIYKNQMILHKIVINLQCIPRLLILVFFLLDIFHFQKFHYFYYSLYLLLLPLLYEVFYVVLQQYYNLNINNLRAILNIQEIIGKDGKKAYSYEYKNPGHSSMMPLRTYLYKQYLPLSQIANYLATLSQLKSKKLFWVNLLVYPVYAIGWGYLFYMALTAI